MAARADGSDSLDFGLRIIEGSVCDRSGLKQFIRSLLASATQAAVPKSNLLCPLGSRTEHRTAHEYHVSHRFADRL